MNIPEWTKPAIYGAAGGAIALAIVGFTWGGWVTGSTASTMAAQASQDAREQLVASICVESFISNPNAARNLIDLKEASSYQQDDFIEDGGWITLAGLKEEEQVSGAADVCADRLVAMEGLPERAMPKASAVDTEAVDAKPTATGG
ncbi:hypothetical protein [Chelativorans alearense]|uniref:hypothetical protein n=1 Tax=Chelativorans alearense TaxID=2681495 RepID=UPI001969DA9D|nr:hypothetical protein [Chelativorans alearense]